MQGSVSSSALQLLREGKTDGSLQTRRPTVRQQANRKHIPLPTRYSNLPFLSLRVHACSHVSVNLSGPFLRDLWKQMRKTERNGETKRGVKKKKAHKPS